MNLLGKRECNPDPFTSLTVTVSLELPEDQQDEGLGCGRGAGGTAKFILHGRWHDQETQLHWKDILRHLHQITTCSDLARHDGPRAGSSRDRQAEEALALSASEPSNIAGTGECSNGWTPIFQAVFVPP